MTYGHRGDRFAGSALLDFHSPPARFGQSITLPHPSRPFGCSIPGEVLMMPFLDVLVTLLVVAIAAWLIHTRIGVPGSMKTILDVVLALIVVGIALWLINTYVPMAGSIKAILNIVVVIATCVGVLQAVGLWSPIEKFLDDLIHHRKPV
jgi:hypothetical protein